VVTLTDYWKHNKTVIFLAGRYRIPEAGTDGIFEQLYKMRQYYKQLVRMGFTVICPNLASAFMDGFITDYEDFLEGTKEQLSRCDIIVFSDDWEKSEGCKLELEHAKSLGLPIILSLKYDNYKDKYWLYEYKGRLSEGMNGVYEILADYKRIINFEDKKKGLDYIKDFTSDMDICEK
jgi:hypothetical protein